MILLRHVILVKTCLRMFQLAPGTIPTHYHEFCGRCGADKTYMCLRFVPRKNDCFLKQRIDIKFCVKLEIWWNMALSVWSRKQTTKFLKETPDILTTHESSHVEITNEEKAHPFLQNERYCSIWIHPTRSNSQSSLLRGKLKHLHEASSSSSFSLCLFQASDVFFLLMDPLDIW
jgi:hypothetical protein